MKLPANSRTRLTLAAIVLTLAPSLGGAEISSCGGIISWDEKMSVHDYMKACDAAQISRDGCRINLEQACVNGVEVNLRERRNIGGRMEVLGFKPQPSRGLKRSDFADPSKMYNVSKTPGGRDLKLCSKAEGLSEAELANLDLSNLPSDQSFVIESVPAIINPDPNLASTTFHWKLTVTNGKPYVEGEFRAFDNLDMSASGINKKPHLTKASGRDFTEVLRKFSLDNLVRCKSAETFTDTDVSSRARSLADYPEEVRRLIGKEHTEIMSGISNSGLDTAALTRRMSQILAMPLPEPAAEESASPPAGKPHAKRKSQWSH